MSEESSATAGGSRRRVWWWVAAITVIVVAIVVYFAVTTSGAPDEGAATPSASPTAGESADLSESGEPSAQPTTDAPEAPGSTDMMPELPPVAPDQPSDNGEGLVARIVTMKAVEGEAAQAGEIGGPAVQFTIELVNDTGEEVDLGLLSLNAYSGEDRVPAGGLVNPGGDPFEGTLAADETARGVYLWSIPENQRDDVTMTIDYRAGEPAFTFRGKVG